MPKKKGESLTLPVLVVRHQPVHDLAHRRHQGGGRGAGKVDNAEGHKGGVLQLGLHQQAGACGRGAGWNLGIKAPGIKVSRDQMRRLFSAGSSSCAQEA